MKIIRLRRELYASSSHSECSYERIQLDMMKCVNRSLAVHTFYIECQSCHHAACAGGGGAPFIVVFTVTPCGGVTVITIKKRASSFYPNWEMYLKRFSCRRFRTICPTWECLISV